MREPGSAEGLDGARCLGSRELFVQLQRGGIK